MKKEIKLVPKYRFPEFVNSKVWEIKNIGDVFSTYSGGTPSTSQKEYYGGNIPFIRSAEINKTKTELFLTNAGLENSSAKLVNKGDLLVALYGANSGDSAISKIDGAINQAILCLKSDYSNSFIYQFLFFKKDWIVSKYIQGGQGNLSGDIIKSVIIPFPEKSEQQKIASCLSSLDNLITAHKEKLEALKDHKKGLMQNLFPQEEEKVPKYRFPEFQNHLNWSAQKIEDFIDLISGIALKGEELTENKSGLPILRGINITEGLIRHSDEIDKYYLGDPLKVKSFIIKEMDIVIAMDGSKVGKNVALISKEDAGSILIQRVARIRAKNADVQFLYQNINSNKFRSYVDTVNTSSGIPHISSQQIKQFTISFPPSIQEQQKIASCLSEVDNLIQAQETRIEELQNHKKGLMQGLFPKLEN